MFSFKNCEDSSDPQKYINNINDILIDLVSETLTISIERAIEKAILKGDQEKINDLQKCKKEFAIFNKTGEDSENYKLRRYYTYLIYYESSESKNDLGQYTDCIESQTLDLKNIENDFNYSFRQEIKRNSTYTIFKIIEQQNKSFSNFTLKDNEHLFGLCLRNGCSNNSIKDIIYEFNDELTLFEKLKESDLRVYNLESGKGEISYTRMVPTFITLLIIILNGIIYLFQEKITKGKLKTFCECFKFDDNFKKILESDEKDGNEKSLNIIRCIRAIILIALVVSKSFIYIYHLPTKVFNETNMEKLINSYSFSLIYYGERFGKKMLYAISGFELTYIMIIYFDKIIRKKKENEKISYLLPPDLVSSSTIKKNKNNKEKTQQKIDDISKPKPELITLTDEEIINENNIIETNIIGNDKKKEEEKKEEEKIEEENIEEEMKEEEKIEEEIKEKKEKEKKERLEKLRKEKEKKEKEKEDEYNKFFSEIIGSKDKNKNLIDSKNEDLESDLFEEKEKNEEKITTENKIEEKETNEIEKGENGDDKENDYENYRKFLTIKDLIIWYSKHIYKYILFIYAIFLFKYGTIYPFMFFQKISPMWILYFEDIPKKLNYYYILANILLFSPFSNESFYWLNPFVLVYNEITFFIIGSFLFYICYKYRIEMNIIIFISFFILLIAKIILGIFLFSRENFHYYPAMFFQYDNTYSAAKSYLSSNQFMKLHLFLLGMFFGNVYYCLTNKGISLKSKKYLELSVKFSKLKLFEFLSEGGRCSNILQYIFLIVFILIYIVLVNCYEMFISFYMKDKNNPEYYTFFSNKTFNIFALFDGDLGVIIFLLIILFLFFIRDNALSKFITHQFWRIIYKPYWSNLLLLHISTTFIFYYSENRIKFDFISIIFFAFQILILLTVLSCIFFVLIEMPLRNLNKIIIKKFQGEENEDNKEDDNDDNKENNDNNDNDVDNDFN